MQCDSCRIQDDSRGSDFAYDAKVWNIYHILVILLHFDFPGFRCNVVVTMTLSKSWVAHMVCCGWYLCASLQTSVPHLGAVTRLIQGPWEKAARYQDTWLGMRISDSSGGNLVFYGDGSLVPPEAGRSFKPIMSSSLGFLGILGYVWF